MAVSQQAPDFSQGGPLPQHVGGERMSELVCASVGRVNTCPRQCGVDDRADRGRSKTTERGLCSQE
jgi:hypothetical protein